MAVLIYTQNYDGKFKKSVFELVTYGKAIADQTGTEAIAVTTGKLDTDTLNELGKYGASKVISVTNDELKDLSAQAYTAAIEQVAKNVNANIIVFGNNPYGRAISPRLAVKLNAGLAAGVVALPSSTSPFTVKKRVYSGKAFADLVIKSDVKILTLNQNSYKVEENPVDISIEEFTASIPEGAFAVKPVEIVKSSGKLSVTDAEILVSGGRGLKGPENWGMLEEMAEILGAGTSVHGLGGVLQRICLGETAGGCAGRGAAEFVGRACGRYLGAGPRAVTARLDDGFLECLWIRVFTESASMVILSGRWVLAGAA